MGSGSQLAGTKERAVGSSVKIWGLKLTEARDQVPDFLSTTIRAREVGGMMSPLCRSSDITTSRNFQTSIIPLTRNRPLGPITRLSRRCTG